MEEQRLIKRKRKALTDGNKLLLINTCIQLAELHFKEGRYEQAIVEYKIVAEKYKESDKLLDYARANRMIGEAYSHLQQYNKALKHQQIHLEVARKEKDPLEEQRALATIGHTYLTSYLDVIDNPDKTALNLAYKSFMKSLVICEKLTGINKREHMDMSTRLFANLGVVQESLGNYDKGIELLQKSIDICKSYDIYEQLQRGHMMMGSLYAKKEDHSNAIHQYNLAAEVASRLDDKTVLISSALSAKADILIKLSDFYAAKTVLLKAHKMKNPNVTDHLNTETILKTVAAMCYTEDSLLTTSATDYRTRKKLYEKMGDGASGLRNYPKAIEYYHKMLEAAINDGESGKDLCPCYISLAQCYSDNKQYEKAIEYYRKEYSVNKNSAKEAVSTLFSIVDAMELARRPSEDKEEIYKVALKHCTDEGDTHLAGKTLIRHINLLKKNSKSKTNVSELERDLIELNFVSSGSESEEETTPNVGVDICVDDITDVSDVSDGERDLNKPRAARKRNKGFIIKRNIKGETQLHTACISGNVTLVRRLLDQGHPVNIRDNCGWLPIHEACICGHLEIVELLLNKGAAINDRGGTLCNGMTPLHDASSNGHLEVIQFLLDRGANATVKTDDGALPIHMLENWRKQNRLDTVRQSFYEVILERFKHTLEASGYDKDVYNCDKENVALVQEDEFEVDSSRAQPALKIGALRRLQDRDDDVDQNKPTSSTVYGDESSSDVSTSTGSGDSNAKDEYKKVMKNLRHHIAKAKKNKSQKPKLTKRTALMEPEDVGDDWLEDDIGINCKKQKLAAGDLINSAGARKTQMGGGGSSRITRKRSSLRRYPSSTDSHSNESVPENFFHSDLDFESEKMEEDTRDIPNEILSLLDEGDNKSNFSQRKKRKKQISLIGAGFSRSCTSSSNDLNTCANVSVSRNPKHQTKLTNFATVSNMAEADSTTSGGASTSNLIRRSSDKIDSRNTMLNDPTLSVDVRIDGRLYRVPVPVSEMHTLTIKWLADEAAKRYCRKEFMKPTLELETKNGAVLAEDDLINIIFPMGNTQAEEINARILKWNLPPLIERYKEACVNMNIDQNEAVSKLLQDVSTTLNLSDLYLRKKALGPLCKALNRHTNLYHLNLSGNFMSTENIQLLCLSLPSLESLAILNLSLNHLVAESLDCMAKMFLGSNRSVLENLVSLDLSYNPLSNDSLKHLAIITRHLKLHTLNLSAVDFTDDIFSHFANKKLDLYLEYVENFDVGLNRLDKDQILKFISWLKPGNIGSLNVSRNNLTEDGLTSELINLFHGADAQLNLTRLNLSGCRVTDSEMYQFLGLLPNVPNLQTLNLSYNSNVTAISLRRFIQHSMSLLHLDLTGCDDILKYFGSCEDAAWIMSENTNLQSLKLSVNKSLHSKECEMLVNMWTSKYREKADVVEELRDFLELSIKS